MPAFKTKQPLNLIAALSGTCRSDIEAIQRITDAAKAMDQYGFALVGGFYVYVTVPYVYVAPIVELELGSCLAQFEPLLSYGGPDECEGANYDDVSKSCASSLTIRDTMGDQGWPGV